MLHRNHAPCTPVSVAIQAISNRLGVLEMCCIVIMHLALLYLWLYRQVRCSRDVLHRNHAPCTPVSVAIQAIRVF